MSDNQFFKQFTKGGMYPCIRESKKPVGYYEYNTTISDTNPSCSKKWPLETPRCSSAGPVAEFKVGCQAGIHQCIQPRS